MHPSLFSFRLTIGVKILRLMGWKDGQGVGPRLKRKKKAKPSECFVCIYRKKQILLF